LGNRTSSLSSQAFAWSWKQQRKMILSQVVVFKQVLIIYQENGNCCIFWKFTLGKAAVFQWNKKIAAGL
jgi:hypothetical protein